MKNKSVKEIANSLGINKLRVYRFIEKENIESVETIKGVKFYDKRAISKINKRFVQNEASDVKSNIDTNDKIIDNEVERLLTEKDARISFIEKQIIEKDKQISQLQTLLNQQQQLALHDKKLLEEQSKSLSDLEDQQIEKDLPINEDKSQYIKKWWQFWR